MSSKPADTRERILEAAETLLRRHGLAKTTVLDVARALGMSHGNVYRHFDSKAALRAAVAERWLKSISDPLEAFAVKKGPAADRLEGWALALAAAKRRKVHSDPEMFAAYHALAEESEEAVAHHVATMRRQVEQIIRDGAARGELNVKDPRAATSAFLDATMRFHHPHLVQAGPPASDKEIRTVVRLVLAGLRAGGV
ncbi:MAG TPA: TetR/AcrR family transcriptional regulator [Myxococcales bacterium]|nr:TetR/AcrR family transcriptional regulator [Myxococcales bacterium]